MIWGSVVKFFFKYFDTSKKMLTLARISPRNIYVSLLVGAHFHWRSLKDCNIAKRTCLNYVWTAIFPWSYCSRKLQMLRLIRAKSSKTIDSLWNARSSHRRCSVRKVVLRNFSKSQENTCARAFFLKKGL